MRASTAQAERDAASLDYLRRNLNRGNKLASSGYLAKGSFDLRANQRLKARYGIRAVAISPGPFLTPASDRDLGDN